MPDELADYDPPFVAFAVVGAVAGGVLGGLVGAAGGELGGFPSGWQLCLFPVLPVLLAAACYSLDRGAGAVKSIALAPVVAVERSFLAIAWVAGYCLVVAPAIGVFALLYGPLGWPRAGALLAGLCTVAVWMFLLSRLPIAPAVDAFYGSGTRACGLLAAALFAAAPALVVGALLGYYLGFLDDPCWDGTGRGAVVGAVLGGLYGLSVGLLAPFTTTCARMLADSET